MNTDMEIEIIMDDNVQLPTYATNGSAGVDLVANIKETVCIAKHCSNIIPTGIKIKIPEGYVGDIRSRSGLAARSGIVVLNSPGTIDSDYRGEIKVILYNSGEVNYYLQPGVKMAQLIILPCPRITFKPIQEFSPEINNNRGEGGFGHTGTGLLNKPSIAVDSLKGFEYGSLMVQHLTKLL